MEKGRGWDGAAPAATGATCGHRAGTATRAFPWVLSGTCSVPAPCLPREVRFSEPFALFINFFPQNTPPIWCKSQPRAQPFD